MFCPGCGKAVPDDAVVCVGCGRAVYPEWGPGGVPPFAGVEAPEVREFAGKKVVAGVLGILLGSLGVHKFVLGMTTPGVIMLLVSLLTCGVGAIPMHTIGLVEGIIYLTKSDREFYERYAVEKKGWF